MAEFQHPRRGDEYSALAAFLAGGVVKSVTSALARCEFRGMERLPSGPYVLVSNHITKIDPMFLVRFVWEAGRMPHFMAKESLFSVPVLGPVMRREGQIPVDRLGHPTRALEAAKTWLDRGESVQVYPEGTLTRDPDLWPMRGKTGAVRLALMAGVPIVPIAHWGAQDLLPRYGKGLRPFPRKRFTVQVGDPIPAAALGASLDNSTSLQEATDRLTREVTALLETLRGPKSSAEIWDPRRHPDRSARARKDASDGGAK